MWRKLFFEKRTALYPCGGESGEKGCSGDYLLSLFPGQESQAGPPAKMESQKNITPVYAQRAQGSHQRSTSFTRWCQILLLCYLHLKRRLRRVLPISKRSHHGNK